MICLLTHFPFQNILPCLYIIFSPPFIESDIFPGFLLLGEWKDHDFGSQRAIASNGGFTIYCDIW